MRDMQLISQLADITLDLLADHDIPAQKSDVFFDIELTHEQFNLRLDEMVQQIDGQNRGSVTHDLLGIYRHFNRVTKTMDNCFVPRYATNQ